MPLRCKRVLGVSSKGSKRTKTGGQKMAIDSEFKSLNLLGKKKLEEGSTGDKYKKRNR